ncbi:MAG: hypothetical protein KJ576_20905 [Proteobacteria bacterium]|nr:hypothetical protein [Pseudomonadota bacterium]
MRQRIFFALLFAVIVAVFATSAMAQPAIPSQDQVNIERQLFATAAAINARVELVRKLKAEVLLLEQDQAALFAARKQVLARAPRKKLPDKVTPE